MATKSANLYARIEPDVKLSPSRPVDMSALSEEELYAEIEKGFADIEAGRVKNADEALADIREHMNITNYKQLAQQNIQPITLKFV